MKLTACLLVIAAALTACDQNADKKTTAGRRDTMPVSTATTSDTTDINKAVRDSADKKRHTNSGNVDPSGRVAPANKEKK